MSQAFLRVSVSSILCAAAAVASAQVPVGPETRVSTALTGNGGERARPAVTPPAPDGSFVVVWTEESTDVDVVARRYDAAGRPLGPRILVNSGTTYWQTDPALAADAAGNFVVVWTSYEPSPSLVRHIRGQRFDPAGTRLGSEFSVSETPAWNWRPSVSAGPSGFVVAWSDYFGYCVLMRRFDAAGVPLGGQVQVSAPAPLLTSLSPSVATAPNGSFLVVWDRAGTTVQGRRFAADGSPLGVEFGVAPSPSVESSVGFDDAGFFVVAWRKGALADAPIVAQRFDPNGNRFGAEMDVVNPNPTTARNPRVAVAPDGDFVVAWDSRQDGSQTGIRARRFAWTGVGPEFAVNTHTTGRQEYAGVASDAAGNFVVAWQSPGSGAYFQRYAGGLMGMEVSVDASAGPASDGNRVLEPGETVGLAPSWLNGDFAPQTFSGTLSAFTGPGAPGDPVYSLTDSAAGYGTVGPGGVGTCTSDCYAAAITVPSTRPSLHWDATVHEQLAPASLGASKTWALHVGDSFSDLPRSNGFYRFVETLLHHGVTGGCAASAYCPSAPSTREQMAVFVLVAKEGSGYAPPPCVAAPFSDVAVGSPFCPWIAELSQRGVVGGCGGGAYCPTAEVSRQQMAVFALATKEPGVTPPACTSPLFNDLPASSPFCPWVEELARRGVVGGCGGGAYCPEAPVTREQMGVFLSVTFGLALYGP